MTAQEWIDLIQLIPESDRGKLVIVLNNGTELCVDTLQRFEPNVLVMRGRMGGTIDEARGFFVPYAHILCLRMDRVVKLEELDAYFANSAPPVASIKETPVVTRSNHPTPAAPTNPADASRLLLDRIRAVQANSANRFNSKLG